MKTWGIYHNLTPTGLHPFDNRKEVATSQRNLVVGLARISPVRLSEVEFRWACFTGGTNDSPFTRRKESPKAPDRGTYGSEAGQLEGVRAFRFINPSRSKAACPHASLGKERSERLNCKGLE